MAIHASGAAAVARRASRTRSTSRKPTSKNVTSKAANTRIGGGVNGVAGTVVKRTFSPLTRRSV